MPHNRDATLQAVTNHLGGREQLRRYVDDSSLSTSDVLPRRPGEVLGDYRPIGGIVIVGFEDGAWWDTDTSARMPAAPHRWAPLPPGMD